MTAQEKRELHFLLDYELRSSQRYRRFVALVYITSTHKDTKLAELLSGAFRTSDHVIASNGTAAVLMPETDHAGAGVAINRVKQHCNGVLDLRFGLAAYPTDGPDARALMDMAQTSLAQACCL